MSTVSTAVRSGSPAPAAVDAPVPCTRFSWCVTAVPGHTTHLSAPVDVWQEHGCVLFAETDPDSGGLLYGPVLGTGEADEPVEYGRALAAELRASAARIEALVARVELAGGAA